MTDHDDSRSLDRRVEATWQRARRVQRAQGLGMTGFFSAWFLLRTMVLDRATTTSGMVRDVLVSAGLGVVGAAIALAAHLWGQRGSWLGAPLTQGLERDDVTAVRAAVAAGDPPADPLLHEAALDHCLSLLRWGVVWAVGFTAMSVAAVSGALTQDADPGVRLVILAAGAVGLGMAGLLARRIVRARRYRRRFGTA